jgi:hypothetical protein
MSLQLSDLAASFLESVRRFGYTTVAVVWMNENRSEPVYMVAQNLINARILNPLCSTRCHSESKCVCSVSRRYSGLILKMATAALNETLYQLEHMTWQYPENWNYA